MTNQRSGQTALLDAPDAGSGWTATVDVTALQKAVAKVLPAVPTKATLPGLMGVLIELGEDGLRLSATDLTTHIATQCPVEVSGGEGAVLLPAKQLADLLARIPAGGSVDLTDRGGLVWGTASYELPLSDPASFPPAPGTEESEPCAVAASVLRRMLNACGPIALAADASRPVLGAIALTISEGRVVQAQATDGTRVARVWAERPRDMVRPVTSLADTLVPASAAKALLATLDELEDGAVSLSRDTTWLTLATSGVRMQVRLLDGHYPDVGAVLDRYPIGQSFAVDRRVLRSALDRLAVVAQAKREALQTVLVELDACGITLRFDGREESGRGRERVDADASGLTRIEEPKENLAEGVLRSVAFPAHVLPDMLRWLSGDVCHVALGGRLMPGGWWGDEPVRFDVMPIRVS